MARSVWGHREDTFHTGSHGGNQGLLAYMRDMSELGGMPAMPRNLAVLDEKLTRRIATCSTSVTSIRNPGKQRVHCVCSPLGLEGYTFLALVLYSIFAFSRNNMFC